jgi:DNA-binding NtrC family response regulator
MDEAAEQQAKLINDLHSQVIELSKRIDAVRAGSLQEAAATHKVANEARSAQRILWVDDAPKNNSFEISYLQKQGIEVVQATSTSEAMALLGNRTFDRIITDLGRYEGNRYDGNAGIEFVKQVRHLDAEVPVIIYSGKRTAVNKRQEALAAGAKDITASATDLFKALEINPQGG